MESAAESGNWSQDEAADQQRIRCRQRDVAACYDGMLASEIYEDGDPAMDGTYDKTTGTVVCDACYAGF